MINFSIGFATGIIVFIIGDILFDLGNNLYKIDWFSDLTKSKSNVSNIELSKVKATHKNTLNRTYFCPNCKKSIIFDDKSISIYDSMIKKITCTQCGERINWENLLIQPELPKNYAIYR